MTSPPHNTYATFPSSGSLPQYGLLSIFLSITSSFTTRCFPFSWQTRHLSWYAAFHFTGNHVIFHLSRHAAFHFHGKITSSFTIRCFPFSWQSCYLSPYAAFHFYGNHAIFHNTQFSIFMAIMSSFTIRTFLFPGQSRTSSSIIFDFSFPEWLRQLPPNAITPSSTILIIIRGNL